MWLNFLTRSSQQAIMCSAAVALPSLLNCATGEAGCGTKSRESETNCNSYVTFAFLANCFEAYLGRYNSHHHRLGTRTHDANTEHWTARFISAYQTRLLFSHFNLLFRARSRKQTIILSPQPIGPEMAFWAISAKFQEAINIFAVIVSIRFVFAHYMIK